jgi:hypothetical protein
LTPSTFIALGDRPESALRQAQEVFNLECLYEESKNTRGLERSLREFKGIGAVTTQIFLRELRGVWVLNPEVSGRAQHAAENQGINLQDHEGETLARLETALVKLSRRYYKKQRCAACAMRDFCPLSIG